MLNTSLNRRGEPIVCSPTDILDMFFGSDLQYLIMEDILVVKDEFPYFLTEQTEQRNTTLSLGGDAAQSAQSGVNVQPSQYAFFVSSYRGHQ